MARKSTTRLSADAKREEMCHLEKELIKSGFRPPLWKRLLRALAQLVVLVIVLGVIGWGVKFLWTAYISNYDGLVAKYVEFRSNGVISKKEILNLMNIQGTESLVSLNVEDLEARLMACPSIRKAVVTREIPSTLIVEVDARLPVAWLDCPQVGIRARDVDRGYFIDSDGVVFPCSANIHAPYLHSPVLQIPAPASGEIHPGDMPDSTKNAVALFILLKRDKSDIGTAVQMISVPNEWSYNVEFDGGTHAVFGIYDLDRQVDNFILILHHAKSIGKQIEHINLIPERNIPVTYRGEKNEESAGKTAEDKKETPQKDQPGSATPAKGGSDTKQKEKVTPRRNGGEKRSRGQ